MGKRIAKVAKKVKQQPEQIPLKKEGANVSKYYMSESDKKIYRKADLNNKGSMVQNAGSARAIERGKRSLIDSFNKQNDKVTKAFKAVGRNK